MTKKDIKTPCFLDFRKFQYDYMLLIFGILLDYSKGFGGKFGVQQDRVDKSAVGWDHQENLQKHESQTGTEMFIYM